jgi:glucose/arabinose dehydrogenase
MPSSGSPQGALRTDQASGVESRPVADTSGVESRPVADTLPELVATTSFTPVTTRIDLDTLPPPFDSESARRLPKYVGAPPDAHLEVPVGFVVQRFAADVPHARWLALAPDGRVLCAQTREERISWFRDSDGDGIAEERGVFADAENALDIPFGMAFAGAAFFVGNHDEVRRFPFAPGQTRLEGEGTRITELPGGGYRQHWTRNVIPAGDGEHLYVSIGSRTNVEPEAEPRGTVQIMKLDGSRRRTFAGGLRNPVGLAVHPHTRVLYATVNERDALGDDLVPDYLTAIADGAFYGWPYAYLSADNLDPRRMRGARSERPDLAQQTRTPDVLFQAHSAALGVAFYDHDAFPGHYRGGAFVAFRGSWNRSTGTGYKLVFVPFAEDRPVGSYEDFVRGFLLDPAVPTTWGRPVDVLVLPDGSLLFTEESGGAIYRVVYPAG